jgi:hypothetical protein
MTIPQFVNLTKKKKKGSKKLKNKWHDPGLNRGPADLQSVALPTELSRLGKLGLLSILVSEHDVGHKDDPRAR